MALLFQKILEVIFIWDSTFGVLSKCKKIFEFFFFSSNKSTPLKKKLKKNVLNNIIMQEKSKNIFLQKKCFE